MRQTMRMAMTLVVGVGAALGQPCDPTWVRFDNTAPSSSWAGVQWDAATGGLVYIRSDESLFEWNGTAWTMGTSTAGLGINMRAGCWDPVRQKLVVGCNNGTLLEWNAATHWFTTRPNSSGITGNVEGLAYDTKRQRLVMVTREWNADQTLAAFEETPSGWVSIASIPRMSRWNVDGLVYDPIMDQVMLLGGDTQAAPITYVPMRLMSYKPRTAAGTGTWSALPLPEGPSRRGATVFMDPLHGMTIFGGLSRYRDYRLEGLGTRDQLTNIDPYFRAYNPARGDFVVGYDQLPTTWSPGGSGIPFHGRMDAAVARNPADGRVVVVGGSINGYLYNPDDGWVNYEQRWNDTLFATARPAFPVFTLQPEDRSYCTTGVGGTASGRLQALVSVCDAGNIAQFRWYKWDAALETYVATPGENQNAFWPTDDVLRASDSGQYRVLAWNFGGMTWSNPVNLTVTDPLVFTQQPFWPADTCPGNSITIYPPTVAGSSPTLVLQRQAGDTGAWIDVMNATPGQPMVFNGVTSSDSGEYRFQATNACGSISTGSHRIQVGASIEGPLTTLGAIEPCGTITIRPLLGSVHGRGPLSYRWFRDGVPLVDDSRVSGTSSFGLTISMLDFADSGTYELRVSDGVCLYPAVATKRIDLPEPVPTFVLRDPNGSRPGARSGHAMAYDVARGVVVLHGGIGPGVGGQDAVLDDTWEFDGTSWTRAFPVHSPGPVHSHAMTYDSTRGRVLMYGGFHHPTCPTCAPLSLLWEWDGHDWTQLSSDGPANSLAAYPAMCYDSVSQRVVVYTGSNSPGTLYQGETWTFDPATLGWARISTSGPGTAYGYPAMYFDKALGKRIMYVHGSIPPNVSPPVPAIWAWGGAGWEIVDTDASGNWPYNQQEFPWCTVATNSWIYNPLTKAGESSLMTVIPTGGGGYFNGTYTTRATAGSTLRRTIDNGFGVAHGAEVWDSRRNCAVIFGGREQYPNRSNYNRPVNAMYERHFRSAPYILDEPQDVPLNVGGAISFRVVAAGAPSLGYHWRHNGVPMFDSVRISGSFTPSLRISNAGPSDSGVYECVVTNSCGSVVSRAARAGSDCRADFDGDGFVDGFDYDAFVACFEGAACPPGRGADFDGDGFVDGFDYDAFVGAFESGCP